MTELVFPGRFRLRRYATRGFTFVNAGDMERLRHAISEAVGTDQWRWQSAYPAIVEVESQPRLVVEFCGRLSVPPSRRS